MVTFYFAIFNGDNYHLKILKNFLKDKTISEDEERKGQDMVQKLTDACVAEIDKIVADKEKELLEV